MQRSLHSPVFGAFVPGEYARPELPPWLLPLNHLLYLLFLGFYLLTAFRDPGIVKRTDHMLAPVFSEQDGADLPTAAELGSVHQAEGLDFSSSLASRSDSEEDARAGASIHRARDCGTCMILRPPLASHCAHCNNCVRNFDQ